MSKEKPKKSLDLSIVIVTYNSEKEIMKCLESIYSRTHRISFEIIIVDNNSKIDISNILSKNYPEVIFFQSEYNAGFARANNIGINMSRGRNILLLNPDILVCDQTISNCLKSLEVNKSLVACGCQLLNIDGSNQFSAGYFERGKQWLADVPFWNNFSKIFFKFINSDKRGSGDVDWIIGAFLMVKRSVIDKAGLLDEDFFLYAEEIEWCHRLGKYGTLTIFDKYYSIHEVGASSEGEFEVGSQINVFDKRERQKVLSVILWLRKQYGIMWSIFAFLNYLVAALVYFVGLIIFNIKNKKNIMFGFHNYFSYLGNIITWARFMPRIIINRPYFYKVYNEKH